ncbi:MAG: ABC transporter substrate-binding protein [Oscillospiraceae bacterium]|jgi:ABC-type nitrate/sulfonate/bicarbonate transport system substrate-binding protein|nr:ABC transporter substrate-binding protein [Oscillospiraceae bacterium]
MKTSKALASISALLLTAAITLSACSGSSGSTTTQTPATNAPATPAADTPAVTGNTGANDNAAAPLDIITLRTSTKKNCTSTPWVVGEALGIFEKHGIKIEYTGEISETLAAVLSGANDLDADSPGTLALQVAEGTEIIGVGFNQVDPDSDDIDRKYQHMRFYVSPDIGVTNFEELDAYNNGGELTISGVGSANCLTFIPQQALRNNGLDPERLSFVGYDSDTAAVQLVQQGDLTIAGIHPPFYYLAEQEGLVRLFDSRDTGVGAASGTEIYYFTKDFVKDNPVAVQRFVDAITEAQKWGLENPDEAVKLTGEYIGREVNAVHYFYNGSNVSGSDVPAKLIQPWIDDLIRYDALKDGQVKISDVFDPTFINNLSIN